MAEKKVGVLVKEARTAAGLTQEKLAQTAGENLTAAMISKCERGEADLTTAQLKKIAVACGVTQKSLVEAPKNVSAAAAKTSAAKAASSKTTSAKTSSAAGKTSTKKTSTSKTSTAKTSTAKTSAAKTSSKASSAKKAETVPANANVSMKVTSTEQKLIQAYRGSTSDRKKAALKLLNGDYGDKLDKILALTGGGNISAASASDSIGEALGSLIGGLFGGK